MIPEFFPAFSSADKYLMSDLAVIPTEHDDQDTLDLVASTFLKTQPYNGATIPALYWSGNGISFGLINPQIYLDFVARRRLVALTPNYNYPHEFAAVSNPGIVLALETAHAWATRPDFGPIGVSVPLTIRVPGIIIERHGAAKKFKIQGVLNL